MQVKKTQNDLKFFIVKAYSSMVERVAHNDKVIGSNPVKLIKKYKRKKEVVVKLFLRI